MPLLTENAMPKAHMSLVQVMRLICHVYSLSFVDKGLYVIQNIYELSYPKTCCEIKSDVTQNLIGRLSFIKDLIDSVQDMQEEYNKSNVDEMKSMVLMKKTKGNRAIAGWLSPVVSYSDGGQNDEKEDSDHANNKDNEDDSDSDDAEAGT
ncbi:hypothetical protein RO3G_14852 [Rhizopus delemar RA 99-880]|uniref:Uncharacterized protein n=1 Tax=Rhizopus delemar (strain RA 99-880 / ATCC MYA-4621 / FGSC 9543 / NRRL 43880) TaxID=246409 RepID=I1CNW1_RHIO9|nr:hypothetical protein RO3G_14852 [Rhizopus delemar RA 99-880]|eukprot:EIE90141.1 hypothetical protein RO3G_14852 [Rhizopus delemar RA 99-880]